MDPSHLTLPKPMPGFGGSSIQPPTMQPSTSSQPANIIPYQQPMAQAPTDVTAQKGNPSFQQMEVQQSSDEKDNMDFESQSDVRSTDSSDSEMETMHLIRKHGADFKYKINSEATHALRHIADTANNDPDFKIADVDLTDFGQKIIDVDFDARTILFDSQNELHSLMALTSESSSGYNSKSSSTSALSFRSVGLPNVKSDTYIQLKRKLDYIKVTRDYKDMLQLKDELEVEMHKMQDEQKLKENIFAGLHLGRKSSSQQ